MKGDIGAQLAASLREAGWLREDIEDIMAEFRAELRRKPMADLTTDKGVQARRNALKYSAEAAAQFKAAMNESAVRGGHKGTAESAGNYDRSKEGERGKGTA